MASYNDLETHIKSATETLAFFIAFTTSKLAIDTIVIMNQESWPFTIWTDLADLLLYPIKSRAF